MKISKIIGAALLLICSVAALAQNAGNVGIQPTFQPVFNAQSTTASSAVFQDVGQGQSLLFYCTSGASGTIDLDFLPLTTTTWRVLTVASFTSDTGCHQLSQGGYFPNLRSTLTLSAGSVSAWYTGMAGPISSIASGVGSSGPTAPPVCDKTTLSSFPTGGTNGIAVPALLPGQIFVFCGFTITFAGATSGNLNFNWITSLQVCSGGLGLGSWSLTTTANTPQTLIVPISQRSPAPLLNPIPCITNNTGSAALISISYAAVSGT